MASGASLFWIDLGGARLPASNYPVLSFRNGHLCWNFDTTTQETLYAELLIPQTYGGGGLDFILWLMAATATSGTIGYGLSVERMDGSTDLDTDSFASEQGLAAAVTVPGTSGFPFSQTITCSSGANMDSAVAGDMIRIRVRRDVTNDTATGDAQLMQIEVREH